MRKSICIVLVCLSYLVAFEILLPRTTAIRIAPNVDDYTIENPRARTRRRQNYVVQRALDDGISADLDGLSGAPIVETLDDRSPEGLTANIVDYANMIRNNIIYLDNSIETTTRKRGNIKKKNQVMGDSPCSCTFKRRQKELGSNYYPESIETLECGSCGDLYRCKAHYYYVTVLRKSISRNEESPIPVPSDFHHKWIAVQTNVTSFCECSRDTLELK